MDWGWWSAAGLLALVTALPHLGCKAWWIRTWDFPRVQLVMCGLLLLALAAELGAPVGVPVLAALCIAYHLFFILPFTLLWKREALSSRDALEAHPERRLSLLIVNVLMTNRRSEGLIESIAQHRPDLILALETDQWWCDRLSAALAEYPHRILRPIENTYGLVFYSRLPLEEGEVRFLLKDDIPSLKVRVVLPSGDRVQFYGVHPMPPSPTEADTSLSRDAELVMVGKEVAKQSLAAIVAGDLNDVAWSHTSRLFRRISGLLDPRIGRGLFNSFHAWHWYARWPLDHVFHDARFTVRAIHRLPSFGSDHFPIFLALDYVPRAEDLQSADAPDADDHQEAAETVQEAKAEERESGSA